MLYFSETVCVLTCSSSLPVRDGALESSNGEANGPGRSSLPPWSDVQLVLLEDIVDGAGDLDGESSSRNRCALDLDGGRSSSADSATEGVI